MTITSIITTSWTGGRVLQAGNATDFLDFADAVKTVSSTHSAGKFLNGRYVWVDADALAAEIKRLTDKDMRANSAAVLPGGPHQALTELEEKFLVRTEKTLDRLETAHATVTLACSPVKAFIDSHLDTTLTKEVRSITTSETIPITQQVTQMMAVLGENCLLQPVTARKGLMNQLEAMNGKATNPAEVLKALNNADIIMQRLTTLHSSVTASIDKERTQAARARDPAAPPIMRLCKAPPDDEDMYQFLKDTITSSDLNSVLVNDMHARRNETYESIVVSLKSIAQYSKKPTTVSVSIPNNGGGSSGGGSGSFAAGAGHEDDTNQTQDARYDAAFAAGAASVTSPGAANGSFQLGNKRPFEGGGYDRECHSRWDPQTQQCDWAKNNGRQCQYHHTPPQAQYPWQQQYQHGPRMPPRPRTPPYGPPQGRPGTPGA